MTRTIDDHRRSIDELDSQILKLILERARHTAAVLQLKSRAGKPVDTREREEAIFDRLIREAADAMQADSIRVIWQVIISMGKNEYLKQNGGRLPGGAVQTEDHT